MNRYSHAATRLASAMLIIGPGLVVCAALVAAVGMGTTTGRWYDNQTEGMLMAAGFSLQLIGVIELCRRIGASRPRLGIACLVASVIGTAGAIFPSAVRVFAAVELKMGITAAQLDRIHGPNSEGTDPLLIVMPFVLTFFLSYFLLAAGLWLSRTGPRYAAVLLAAGTILFVIGQSSFEVNMPAYVSGVTAWWLGLAAVGFALVRGSKTLQPTAVEARPSG